MRSVFFVALAIAVLVRSDAVPATAESDQVELSSKTAPDSPLVQAYTSDSVLTKESSRRFLRIRDAGDDDLTSMFAAHEERARITIPSKALKKLTAKNTELKSLAAIAKKANAKIPLPKAGSITFKKFTGWTDKGLPPGLVKSMGLAKSKTELASYTRFFEIAQLKKAIA